TLFLYKTTRDLRNQQSSVSGDTGADARTTLKALTKCGVPDAKYWAYERDRFDEEPPALTYRIAKPMSGLRYFRIDRDPNATTQRDQWQTIASFLAAGFPILFGFSVPASLDQEATVHYRPGLDSIRGGQMALAFGYRLNHFGKNQHALRFRSSWGTQWGDEGNGLISAGVFFRLARDFWTLIDPEWTRCDDLRTPLCVGS
ncbi:MAG: hypothetical protein AAFU85_26695, partial [Planctomycetota bacterium]